MHRVPPRSANGGSRFTEALLEESLFAWYDGPMDGYERRERHRNCRRRVEQQANAGAQQGLADVIGIAGESVRAVED